MTTVEKSHRVGGRARPASPERAARWLFLLAAFISLVLSITLWFTGSENQGIFVGLWVPSILSLGALVLRRGDR